MYTDRLLSDLPSIRLLYQRMPRPSQVLLSCPQYFLGQLNLCPRTHGLLVCRFGDSSVRCGKTVRPRSDDGQITEQST